MEDWVRRALARWPNVPALFGWLSLDGRGRWRIRGELISRPQIVDTIERNYAADEHGRWYFQNGPQRGYVALESAPMVLRVDGAGKLVTHTDEAVREVEDVRLDEHGALWLRTEHGPAVLDGDDLEWALSRLTDRENDNVIDDVQLGAALDLPSGEATGLTLRLDDGQRPIVRLDRAAAPAHFGFVRDPQPLPQEDAQKPA
jgi:hypothetical protein